MNSKTRACRWLFGFKIQAANFVVLIISPYGEKNLFALHAQY